MLKRRAIRNFRVVALDETPIKAVAPGTCKITAANFWSAYGK
ncbi:hypothetical protein IMCC9480_2989 [Oxalobacteraceae bacterium IMCC9480]|nr:hypothetical protein IMCC9480_2989 [Oxalobacteraceae bacterium IMCC9480]